MAIAELLDSLHGVRVRAREKLTRENKEKAPFFDPLGLWHDDENTFSRVIAYFINPIENHGQGTVFLKGLLRLLDSGLQFSDSQILAAKVYTNYRIYPESSVKTYRLLDILIELPENRAVIIENKSHDAKDQEQQVPEYIRWAREKYKNPYLIYLTAQGGSPQVVENSDLHHRHVHEWSLSEHLMPLVHEWQNLSSAEIVLHFLTAFERRLSRHINRSISDMSEIADIVEHVVKTKESISTTVRLLNSATEIMQEMEKLLERELQIVISREVRWMDSYLGVFPEGSESFNLYSKSADPFAYLTTDISDTEFKLSFYIAEVDPFGIKKILKKHGRVLDEISHRLERLHGNNLRPRDDPQTRWQGIIDNRELQTDWDPEIGTYNLLVRERREAFVKVIAPYLDIFFAATEGQT